jgi:prophage tail gpP-like protein
MPDDGDLSLVVGGAQLLGWTSINVTRSIERVPNSFDISFTEKYPGDAEAFVCQPGDSCEVKIGGDTVITGYVDRLKLRLTGEEHTVGVVGRSKSADFVDCSAEWKGGQITGNTALGIVQKLAQPYKIDVAGEAEVGPPIPQFNLTLGETPYAISERVCRYHGLLIYDMPDGSMVLAQAGNGKMASGLAQGKNIQTIEGNWTMDERYSDYDAWLQSLDTMVDVGDGGNLLSNQKDSGVKRHRLLDIIAEAGGGGQDVCKRRAIWEMNRRIARSLAITASVDSWRDSDGTLWTPNYSIPVDCKAIKAPAYDWLIGEVTYIRDEQGTRADLLIMPKDAFKPEPILLLPFAADVPPQ